MYFRCTTLLSLPRHLLQDLGKLLKLPTPFFPDSPSRGSELSSLLGYGKRCWSPEFEAAHFPKATPGPSLREGLGVSAFIADEIGAHSFLYA